MTTRIFFRNLVYSDLFIAFCALMMAWETQQVFSIPSRDVLLFIFFATLCSYSFHSLVNIIYPSTDERHLWNTRNKTFLLFILLVSGAVVCVYTWRLRSGILYILIAGLTTFLYSAPNIPFRPFIFLRRIAIGKTTFLALVWTYVTAMMPMLIGRLPLAARHYYYLGSRFFLVYAICILFDLKGQDRGPQKRNQGPPDSAFSKIDSIHLLPEPVFFAYLYRHDTFFRVTPSCICFHARSCTDMLCNLWSFLKTKG